MKELNQRPVAKKLAYEVFLGIVDDQLSHGEKVIEEEKKRSSNELVIALSQELQNIYTNLKKEYSNTYELLKDACK